LNELDANIYYQHIYTSNEFQKTNTFIELIVQEPVLKGCIYLNDFLD